MYKSELLALKDLEYKEFQSKLIPTVSPERIIGIRTPVLRKLASALYNTTDRSAFMKDLPHEFYEENNLHAFFIEKTKDFDRCIELIDEFLPYVDNWATCDSMNPPILNTNLIALLQNIKRWMASEYVYEVRFGICMLMRYYLDSNFDVSFLKLVADVKMEEYYIKMMVAWFFATALAKQSNSTVSFLSEYAIDVWTHNKAIQKAIESKRISAVQKEHLRLLKVRKPEI